MTDRYAMEDHRRLFDLLVGSSPVVRETGFGEKNHPHVA
jgi:hypothetical protein